MIAGKQLAQPDDSITARSSFRGKRILMIAPQPFYADRGTPMNTLLMCRVLTAAGLRVDLAVFPTGNDIGIPNLHIYRPPKLPGLTHIPIGASWIKLIYDGVLLFYAFIMVMARRYDVFHGIEEGAVMAAILGKISNKPVIYDMDSNLPEQLGTIGFIRKARIQPLVERASRWAASRSALILTVCRTLSLRARRIAPRVPVVQIEDIPLSEHGRRSSRGTSRPDEIEALKHRHGLSNGRVALYTGNLETYQGIDLMLSAWQWVKTHRSDQDATLVVVGGNPAHIAKYGDRCRRLGIDEAIVWVGQRPAAEMEAWMSLADILLSPRSQGDNTPLKLFSYMASGKPVVATRRDTHTQIVDDSEAFLAEPDPADFGRAISHALANRKDAAGRARKAREKIRSQYTYDVFRSKLLAAYGLVLNGNRQHDTPWGWKTK